MIGSFLLVMAFWGWGLALKCALKEIKMGGAIFAAYLGSSAFMYVFCMLLGIYKYTAYFLMYGGLVAFAVCTLYLFISKKIAVKDYFSPSAVIFVILGFSLSVIFKGQGLEFYDDFSHWAKAVKELYLFDRSYINANTTLGHIDYTPALTYLSYAATKAFGFSNGIMYLTRSLSVVAGMAWLFDHYLWRKAHVALFSVLCITVSFSMFSATYALSALLIDLPMGVLFGIACAKIFLEKAFARHSYVVYLLLVYQLTLIKPFSGLLFAVLVTAYYCISGIQTQKHDESKVFNVKKHVAAGASLLLCVILVQVSFTCYYVFKDAERNYEIAKLQGEYLNAEAALPEKPVFSLSMLFQQNRRSAGAMDVLLNPGNPQHREIRAEFFNLWKSTSIGTARSPGFTIPLYLFLLLCCVGAYCMISSRSDRRRILTLLAIWIVAFIAYTVGTYVAYVTWMGRVSDVMRFAGVYIMSLTVIVIAVLAESIKARDRHSGMMTAALTFLAATVFFNTTWGGGKASCVACRKSNISECEKGGACDSGVFGTVGSLTAI